MKNTRKKKKMVLTIMVAVAFAAVMAFNVNLGASNSSLSDIALANIEALAKNEEVPGTGGMCIVDENEECKFIVITQDGGHVVTYTNAKVNWDGKGK